MQLQIDYTCSMESARALDLPGATTGPAASARIGGCTALKVRRLARRITQIYDEALLPFGLTVGQLGLLSSLTADGLGVRAIADCLSADASTISRLLKPLETAGLVSIGPDPDDGRAKMVRLTAAGDARRRAAAGGWQAAQARVSDALGEGRLAALRFIIDDAHAHL